MSSSLGCSSEGHSEQGQTGRTVLLLGEGVHWTSFECQVKSKSFYQL